MAPEYAVQVVFSFVFVSLIVWHRHSCLCKSILLTNASTGRSAGATQACSLRHATGADKQRARQYKQPTGGILRVLVVEDEASLARRLTAALLQAGYAVDHAADGERAELLGHDEQYDAVVLDLGLPKVDGLALLRRWRETGQAMPVLVLTARGSWHEKVQGIDGGADDYMAKPFRMEELLARLRALIRRSSGHVNPELRCGPLVLDPRASKVTLEGAEVKLTSHEFRVLSYLMHHSQRVVSQSELTEHIYSQGFDRDSNTVEVFIARLRRKLGPSFIETVRGLGYRMRETGC
jgi:two-component system OmpR family response regulator